MAGGFYHISYRPIVIEVKFMHHVFSVLDNPNLQGRGEDDRTSWSLRAGPLEVRLPRVVSLSVTVRK